MINVKVLGLTGGILSGAWLFIITIISIATGYANKSLMMVMDNFPGYSITAGGSIVGLIYGFIHGFIWFYLIGWLYNRLLKAMK